MTDYSQIRQQASAAIQEAGADIVLRVITGGTVDHTGQPSAETETDHTVKGIKRSYIEREIDGTLILQGDLQVIIEAKLSVPAPTPKKDQLVIGGEVWGVENCNPLAPGDVTILYKLQARKP
jgi:hypothetical protein